MVAKDNRRRDERYPVSLSVELHTMGSVQEATVQNMSISGMGFYLDKPLHADSEVTLNLFLVEDGIEDETTPPLFLGGHVMWCEAADGGRGFLAGVRFSPLGPKNRGTLEGFFARVTA